MALYKRVAHVYVNKRILDIETPDLNPNNRDTIAELVRDELLIGQPTEELESLLASKKYLNKVFRAIHPAYNYLRSRGIEIYHKAAKEDDWRWEVAGDLAFMYPMLEMSGPEHYVFMDAVNYVYNEDNPLNDHKVNMPAVHSIVNKLRVKPKYERLNRRDEN